MRAWVGILAFLLGSLSLQASGQVLLPNAQQTFVDANGVPLAGGHVFTYVPGSTTPKTTWLDPNLTVANANPILLDAAGRATIWGNGLYREIVQDSLGVQQWDLITSAGQNFLPTSLLGFGAKCDGTSDDALAFSAAIAASAAAGGGAIYMPPGKVCATSQTIAFSTSGTGLICPNGGAAATHNIGSPPLTGCWLKWIGPPAGTLLSFVAPSGSLSDGFLTNETLQGINLDCNAGLAANGLQLQSLRNSAFLGVYVQNCSGGFAIDVNVVQGSPSNFGDPCDSQFNQFTNVTVNEFAGTSVALRLGDWVNTLLANGGCNASYNTFTDFDAEINNGGGILIDGGDNNFFNGTTRVFRAGGGSGISVDLGIHANIDPGTGLTSYFPALSNHFAHLSVSSGPGAIIARGQATVPTCDFFLPAHGNTAANPSCSQFNVFDMLDIADESLVPKVELGAQVQWKTAFGREIFCGLPWIDPECFGAVGDGVADDTTALNKTISVIGQYVGSSAFPTGTLHLHNGAYKVTSDIILDFGTMVGGIQSNGFKIRTEAGIIDGTSISGTPTLEFRCTGIAFCNNLDVRGNLTLKGGNTGGPIFKLGRDDLADEFLDGHIDYLVLENFGAGVGAAGALINHVQGMDLKFQNSILANNAGSTASAVDLINMNGSKLDLFNTNWGNLGTGLLLNGAQNIKHNTIGIYSMNGGNLTGDTCVKITNLNAQFNTFSTAALSCNTGINASAGAGNHFLNLDLSGTINKVVSGVGAILDMSGNGIPTVNASSGLGAGATIAIGTNSRDQAGIAIITFGTGATNNESLTLNLASLFAPAVGYACSLTPQDGSISWATAALTGAIRIIPVSQGVVQFLWTVTGANIANGNILSIVWNCNVF